MNRHESSRLGALQAEGNLGNERHRKPDRSSGSDSGRDRVRNRPSEGPSSGSSMDDRSRSSSERMSGDEWSWNDSDTDSSSSKSSR